MIDNIILKFCNLLDKYIEFMDNIFAPRCKCKIKNKKNHGKNKSKRTSNKEWIKDYKE